LPEASTGWNADVNPEYTLAPVAGKPNTYSATIQLPTAANPNIGEDSEVYFKYILKPDPIQRSWKHAMG